MSISRETAIEELKLTRTLIDRWIEELEHPSYQADDGRIVRADPSKIQPHASVEDFPSIPRDQFKAELALASGKLEVIAATV